MNDKELFAQYVDKMDSFHDEYFRSLKSDLYKGHNSYLRMRMKGSSFFNDEWIKKIEGCLYELGQIVNNPREVTTTEGVLTPIELAKKVNYESIQHLSSHSQYVKDIDEKGNVIPAKILSQMSKDELHTYENRFIATFIRRLVLFIEKRYEFIKSTVNFDTRDILYVKNKSIVNGQEVEIETKITVNKESDDNLSKIGREYVSRIEKMRTYINYYYVSPFMKEFKNEKDVRHPILQTNIIRKNPLYRKCYETFLFIERFDSLGVQYTLDQKYQSFNEKQRRSLNYILLSTLLSLESTKDFKPYKKSEKTYKPRILSTLDDEIFTYGDLLRGPIKYVRVDDKYTEYLNSKISKAIPEKPNVEEKKYFEEEIELKKATTKHNREVEKLLNRIRREIAKWEKKVARLMAERKIEDAELAKAELEALRKQEEDILNKKRQAIIDAALADKVEEPIIEEPVVEEEPVIEEEKVEEPVVEETAPIEETPTEEPIVETPVEEEKVEEPIIEETPIVEAEPVKEENVEEEPIKEEAPIVEPVVEPTKEEQPEEIPPVEEPVQEETKPVEEVILPIKEEKKEKEPKKATNKKKSPQKAKKSTTNKKEKKPAKAAEVAKKEEVKPVPVPVKEVKEKPAKKASAPKKKATPKKAPVKKEPEAKKEPAKKEPVKKAPIKKEPAKQKPVKKAPAPVKKEPKKDVLEVIPGRFIVKTEEGYFIKNGKFSKIKGDAHIFTNFNEAKQYKNRLGGKVIKL